MASAGSASGAVEDTVVLVVGGNPGVRVEGACVVRTAGGDVSEAIAAAVPFERRWRGTGLRCELASDGEAVVEVTRGGNRSRTASSGGRTVIDVR